MPIDFSSEEKKTNRLVSCTIHNLKYDPAVTWGCVLCRKQQKKRISGYLVFGGIFILIASGFSLYEVLGFGMKQERSRAMLRVGAARGSPSGGDGNAVESVQEDPEKCLFKFSQEIERCLLDLEKQEKVEIMDKEICLEAVYSLSGRCPGDYSEEQFLNEPLYSFGELPGWQAVRSVFEKEQQSIEECVEEDSYYFGVRFTVNGETGKAVDTVLAARDLTPSARVCIYDVFNEMEFPSDGGDYTLMTFLNSEVLVQNRVSEEDKRKEEFSKFVEEQRKACEVEQRRQRAEQIREQVDRKYKEDVENSR